MIRRGAALALVAVLAALPRLAGAGDRIVDFAPEDRAMTAAEAEAAATLARFEARVFGADGRAAGAPP